MKKYGNTGRVIIQAESLKDTFEQVKKLITPEMTVLAGEILRL